MSCEEIRCVSVRAPSALQQIQITTKSTVAVLSIPLRVPRAVDAGAESRFVKTTRSDAGLKKFEALARELQASISNGTLRSGDRLPSMRELVKSRGLSPSTVFEALYLLERDGLVEARPRSGYYVKARRAEATTPQRLDRPARPRVVEISDVVLRVLATLADRDVVPIGSAFPDPSLFPLDRIARGMASRMRKLAPQRMLRDLSAGSEELRRRIALRYMSAGMAASPDELVITSGAMEALGLCLQAVTRPGDLVAIESPAFYGCLQTLDRLGLRALEIPTDPTSGLDIDALAKALEKHPVKACWCMTNFQNPTGATIADAAKRKLVALLARRRIPLIEDDVYGELYFGLSRPLPAKAFDREGWVLHCGSFSKSLAPGYRVGWACAGRFAREVQRLKLMSTISVAVPSQMAVLDYLERGPYEKHLRTLREKLQRRCELAVSSIRKSFPRDTRITQPGGGYFLWLQLPEHVDAMLLHSQALSQGVTTGPGHLFSSDDRYRSFLRINFGQADEGQMSDALSVLGRLATLAAPPHATTRKASSRS
jgi:DNA-binding transcriptional MocR family regulator